MATFNRVASAIFDRLLAPFGAAPGWAPWLDLLLWSALSGVVALLVYKLVSNQRGIARTKNLIKLHLLEIRLFKEDLLGVLAATAKILLRNALYIAHNLAPMAVMLLPMLVILAQLVAWYGYDPLPEGSVRLLKLQLDREHAGVPATAVTLQLSPGVVLEAPPVRTARGEIAWRLRAETAGEHELVLRAGDEVQVKRLAVGGSARKVPVLRTKSWESLLYPGEEALPRDSAFESIRVDYPPRALGLLPDGEPGILLAFLVLSLLVGFAFKGVLGVTI
jgi:hypothetical protein